MAEDGRAEEAAHVPVAHPIATDARRDLISHVGERRRQGEGLVVDRHEAKPRAAAAAAAEACAMVRAVVRAVVSAVVRAVVRAVVSAVVCAVFCAVVCAVVCVHPRGALSLTHVGAQLCDVRGREEVVEDGHLGTWGCRLGTYGCRLCARGCRMVRMVAG